MANSKKHLAWIAVVILLAIAGVVAYIYWPKPAKPATAETPIAELFKYGATDDFKNLPKEKKKAFVDELSRRSLRDLSHAFESMDEDSRMKFMMNNLRDNVFFRLADGYFALPEGSKRVAYLDSKIDEINNLRKEAEARAATRPAASQPAAPPWSMSAGNALTMMKNMIENIPPEQMARFSEFRKAMRDRRAERGIPEPKYTPGR